MTIQTGHRLDAADRAKTAALRERFANDAWVDALVAAAKQDGVELTGDHGFLAQLMVSILERTLMPKLAPHLSTDVRGEPPGQLRVEPVRQDRDSSAAADHDEPAATTLPFPVSRSNAAPSPIGAGSDSASMSSGVDLAPAELDDSILALYAAGMSPTEIQGYLTRTNGVYTTPEKINELATRAIEETREYRTQRLDARYPIVYVDSLRVRIGDDQADQADESATEPEDGWAHLLTGITERGTKRLLGVWATTDLGDGFWSEVCAELRDRGVRDILFLCCDGTSALPAAAKATWGDRIEVSHPWQLIRTSARLVPYAQRRLLANMLRNVHSASTEIAARRALDQFAASDLGRRYPTIVDSWEDAWPEFVRFLRFPPALRRVLSTTTTLGAVDGQLRTVVRTRGRFPSAEFTVDLLWLAIKTAEHRVAERRIAERRGSDRRAADRPVPGWSDAYRSLLESHPGRVGATSG